jgi:hypothetical protein
MNNVVEIPKSIADIEREAEEILRRLVIIMTQARKQNITISFEIAPDPNSTDPKSPVKLRSLNFNRSAV